MALGKLTRTQNLKRRFGAGAGYWSTKVQSELDHEEYWLATDKERQKFVRRSEDNLEDVTNRRRGVFTIVENSQRKFGSDSSYYSVTLSVEGVREIWFLTSYDLERLRKRAENNSEDIEANKESWLSDLLD